MSLDKPWTAASTLSPDEQQRAARLRDPIDRNRWSATRLALRVLLGALLACPPEAVPLRGARDVRAHLDGAAPWLSFNISHSGALAVIAFARGIDVGVDLEFRRPHPPNDMLSVARRVFPPSIVAGLEREPAARLPDAFLREWVRNEALTKCRGNGLVDLPDGPRSRHDPEVVVDVSVGPDHVAALATSDAPSRVELLERR